MRGMILALTTTAALALAAGALAQPAEPAPPAPAAAPALPPGVTPEQVAAGKALFGAGTCGACHGPEGKGTGIAPDLTAGTWLWSDGSLAALKETISNGVPAPKKFSSPMPPMGAASLSPADLDAVTAYVWTLGHNK